MNCSNGVISLTIGPIMFYLTRRAVAKLQNAKTAIGADFVFCRFASHVPRQDRLAVWEAVDSVTL